MATSQRSYASLNGKFTSAVGVLKTLPVYNPNKVELKIPALETLITNSAAKDALVISTGGVLKDLRNSRRNIAFYNKDSDVNCVDNLFKNILSYLKSDFGDKHQSVLNVSAIIKKLHPVYEKKEEVKEGEEPTKSRSESEKSFQSLANFGIDIFTIITGLGETYKPSNEAILPAAFKAKVDELAKCNSDIAVAEKNYSEAVKGREDAYYGSSGIVTLTTAIKNYLASLEGGKKNAAYIAFSNALK